MWWAKHSPAPTLVYRIMLWLFCVDASQHENGKQTMAPSNVSESTIKPRNHTHIGSQHTITYLVMEFVAM